MTLRKIIWWLLLFGAVAAGALAFFSYRDLRQPLAHDKATTYLTIPRGSSVDEIVDKLNREGVIGHKLPLLFYIKMSGAGNKLKAGEYTFPSPITPLQVLQKLEEGQQRLARFTVIEGWTRWDIAAAMSRLPELKMTATEILALMDNTAAIRDLDAQATNLEGYLYPDTYSFPPQTSADEMIKTMVARFRKIWQDRFAADARPPDAASVREVMTVASLIESEAKLSVDRPLVASVIYNRLDRKMNLGIDSTVIYAARLAGKWRNDGKIYQSYLDMVSPYNTRKNIGLPPGPVVSPGADSIAAALHPAATDYLYYVREPSRNDGAHNFYADENDFARGVQALRDWERQRDAREQQEQEGAADGNSPTNANVTATP